MLKEILTSIYPLSNESFKLIEAIVEYESHAKGTTFVHKNRTNNKEYILLDGICKSFLFNPDGDEITITFFNSKSILSPYTTRTLNGLSTFYFKALTPVEFVTLDSNKFDQLILQNNEIREFANRVLRLELLGKIKKEINLASLSAKDRLLAFREQFPTLENLIPHPDIASYLGITTISLSRLRGKK
jgi:CRP-like cAMP-binding protein